MFCGCGGTWEPAGFGTLHRSEGVGPPEDDTYSCREVHDCRWRMQTQAKQLRWRTEGRDELSYEGRFIVSPYEDDDRYRYEIWDRLTNSGHDHMFTLDQAKAHCQSIIDQEHNR